MPDLNRLEDLMKLASQKDTADKSKLLQSLSEKDKKRVDEVLSDPELTKKILSSDKAQEFIKKIFGEK